MFPEPRIVKSYLFPDQDMSGLERRALFADAVDVVKRLAVHRGVGIAPSLDDVTIRAVEPMDLWLPTSGDYHDRWQLAGKTWRTGPLTAETDHLYIPSGGISPISIVVLIGLSVVALRETGPIATGTLPGERVVTSVPDEPPGTAVVLVSRGSGGPVIARHDVRVIWDASALPAQDEQLPVPVIRGPLTSAADGADASETVSLPLRGQSYRGWFAESLIFLAEQPFSVRLHVAHTRPAGDWLMFHGFIAEPRGLCVQKGWVHDATTDPAY